MAALSRRSKIAVLRDTDFRDGREQQLSLEAGPRMSSHTGCDCDQTLKLLGFALRHDGCPGQEKMPHSRASSSIMVIHDNMPIGSYSKQPKVANDETRPSIYLAEYSRRSNTPLGLENYQTSCHPSVKSTHMANLEIIPRPPPALVTTQPYSPQISPPFSPIGPDDASSFVCARFQATLRSTRSRATSDFPRGPKVRPPPKLKKRTSASW
ncbi:hypothetical protein RhiJN_02931 [Ceratobasidium sp. AG-Ba]|nr:hypothetical protein RhiJN_02931 [Ceratobasidium sp. AG-Ba]QRW03818.1 hypothetical protein RhiLY_02817 [Ceratobasidium sp. AG-Ba]